MAGYASTMDKAALKQAMDRFDESPETEDLIPQFLNLVFG